MQSCVSFSIALVHSNKLLEGSFRSGLSIADVLSNIGTETTFGSHVSGCHVSLVVECPRCRICPGCRMSGCENLHYTSIYTIIMLELNL